MRHYGPPEKTIGAADPARQLEEGRSGASARSEGRDRQGRGEAPETGEPEKAYLEALKKVHDHGDMIAKQLEGIRVNIERAVLPWERRCAAPSTRRSYVENLRAGWRQKLSNLLREAVLNRFLCRQDKTVLIQLLPFVGWEIDVRSDNCLGPAVINASGLCKYLQRSGGCGLRGVRRNSMQHEYCVCGGLAIFGTEIGESCD